MSESPSKSAKAENGEPTPALPQLKFQGRFWIFFLDYLNVTSYTTRARTVSSCG